MNPPSRVCDPGDWGGGWGVGDKPPFTWISHTQPDAKTNIMSGIVIICIFYAAIRQQYISTLVGRPAVLYFMDLPKKGDCTQIQAFELRTFTRIYRFLHKEMTRRIIPLFMKS
jgi:hypothetical protein